MMRSKKVWITPNRYPHLRNQLEIRRVFPKLSIPSLTVWRTIQADSMLPLDRPEFVVLAVPAPNPVC